MRIAGGVWRGRRVAALPGSRPTTERVREALFSIWGSRLEGCHFLELFCGSGVVGLEAASRGARAVAFVDQSPQALRRVEASCRLFGLTPEVVWRANLPRELDSFGKRFDASFDLAFADPPYRFRHYQALVRGTLPLLRPAGELALEHSARVDLGPVLEAEEGLVGVEVRRYGETALTFCHCDGSS